MKKSNTKVLIILICSILSNHLNAQVLDEDSKLAQGNNIFSFSYGLGCVDPLLKKSFVRDNSSNLVAKSFVLDLNSMSGTFEHLIMDRIGLSLEFYSTSRKIYFENTLDFNNSNTINGDAYTYSYLVKSYAGLLRGSYHFLDDEEDVDLYGFLGVGYNRITYLVTSNDPLASTVKINPLPIKIKPGIGFRYYVSKKFAVMAEVSAGTPIISGGFSFRFRV